MKKQAKKAKKLSPLKSLLYFIINWISFRVHFLKSYNKQIVSMEDGSKFEIFRHLIIGNIKALQKERGALFIVKFKLSEMTVEKNINFSRFPIPMFTGLPGFRAKFWLLNRETGYNQGIYQWKTEQDAINYSKSFAVDFMSKRSEANSISYKIISNQNIYEYLENIKSHK